MGVKKRKSEETKEACNDKISNRAEAQVKAENVQSDDTEVPNLCHISYKDHDINSTPSRRKIKRESSTNCLPTNCLNRTEEDGDKYLRSNDTPQRIARSSQKRKLSISSDCDVFKEELEDLENLQKFEHVENIELAHDLDTVIRFNDIDETSNTLFSTMIDTSHIQTETDDSTSQINMNKDPLTDPLFISDHEEKNTDGTSVDLESKFSLGKEVQRRRSTRNFSKPIKKVHANVRDSFVKDLDEEEIDLFKDLEEQEELPLIVREKLQELHIKLIHEVPPQHQIELTGSHAPTRQIRKLFQTHGPLRKGLYSPTEDKIIMKNWETFCQLHNWDVQNVRPFFSWRYNGRYYIANIVERQRFVQFLANGLHWRTLYSVYHRFKVLYQKRIIHVRYTPEEDRKILKYMKSNDSNYVKLANLLRRTTKSVCKRYQLLKKKSQLNDIELKTEPKENVRWTLPLIKKFIQILLSITLNEDIKELKYATLPKPIWQKMEEKLNIHEKVLKTFWQHQLHLQLFSPSGIYLNDIKIQLIEYMYAKGISHTREIIWPNVARHFEGATPEFLCKVFYYLVQECNLNNVGNFAETVEYLYHKKIPEIQQVSTDKFLPRIIWKSGKILVDALDAENSNDTILSGNDSGNIDIDLGMNSNSDSDTL